MHNVLLPVVCERCDHGCSCYYDSLRDMNIVNCSANNFKQLPPSVPNNTNWLDLSRNKLDNIEDIHLLPYFRHIQHIDLSFNNITKFSDNLVTFLRHNSSVLSLNLEGNKITELPQTVSQLNNRTKLRLGGNPYICNCDTLWMKEWLYKLSLKGNAIPDFKNVTCGSGPQSGVAVYELDKDKLGCVLEWYWIVIMACSSVVIFVTAALVLHRNWEKLKFLLFVHFDILTTDDGVENLDDMHFDGFVSYRYLYLLLSQHCPLSIAKLMVVFQIITFVFPLYF